MKVVFLLPGSGHRPVGGFKVVYEYANHLAARGHQVEIQKLALYEDGLSLKARGTKWLKHRYGKVFRAYLPTRWFAGLKQRRRDIWWLKYL